MLPVYTLLYRSDLASCNFSCFYCPFRHTESTPEELLSDQYNLFRFVEWIAGRPERFRIFFTPKGEVLIHPHYQEALVRLSFLENVEKTVIQTNLSCDLSFLDHLNPQKTAFWCTWHPDDMSMDHFLKQTARLRDGGYRFSAGAVGIVENIGRIQTLRERLPKEIYLWINAFKREPDYYSADEIQILSQIDPFFQANLRPYPSHGLPCKTGSSAFTVSGSGDLQRCHFDSRVIGNIYQSFPPPQDSSLCSQKECRCYIGYIFLPSSGVSAFYGETVLERIRRFS